jgi:hypothetical protein
VSDLGSNKKIIQPGDVIISRLRPYLRQIAFIPNELAKENVILACSTEFFVLRGKTDSSIAFLVGWLLEADTQELLRVGQEGGHHPRFSEEHLLKLLISDSVLSYREELSRDIERASELNIQAMKILGSFPI